MKKTEIKIRRIKHFLECGGGQSLNIFVDGNKVDSIDQGKSKTICVTQGIHSIHVGMIFCNSNCLSVNTQDVNSLNIEVGTWIYGWKIIFAIFFILVPVNLFYIRRIVEVCRDSP